MRIFSSAFEDGGIIPKLYTCNGQSISPPLFFADIPNTCCSLTLIIEDPDVPLFVREDRLWVHWIIFNMPPDTIELITNQPPPGIQARSTGGTVGYEGPCPPDREHRYFFKLYALDCRLDILPDVTRDDLLQAMSGHIIETAELMGRYKKPHS